MARRMGLSALVRRSAACPAPRHPRPPRRGPAGRVAPRPRSASWPSACCSSARCAAPKMPGVSARMTRALGPAPARPRRPAHHRAGAASGEAFGLGPACRPALLLARDRRLDLRVLQHRAARPRCASRAQGEAINLTPGPAYPVNLGMACPKGWEALTPLARPRPGHTPLLRAGRGEGRAGRLGSRAAGLLRPVAGDSGQPGPAVGRCLGTGQIVTEEMALLGALAKFGLGVIHGDSNTRQCMATAPTRLQGVVRLRCPALHLRRFRAKRRASSSWGSNLCIAHPILWQRIMRNPAAAGDHGQSIRAGRKPPMAATRTTRPRPKTDLVAALRRSPSGSSPARGRWTAPTSPPHTPGFESSPNFVASLHRSSDRLAETGLADGGSSTASPP